MKKTLVLELGQGTSLRKESYTKAATRAVEDALWKNSIGIAGAFGFSKGSMIIDVTIGVQKPQEVDKEAIKKVLPYGNILVKPEFGGLDIASTNNTAKTIVAVAAILVSLDVEG